MLSYPKYNIVMFHEPSNAECQHISLKFHKLWCKSFLEPTWKIFRRIKEIRSNLLYFPWNLHAANWKIGKACNQSERGKYWAGNWDSIWIIGFISNPKSLKSLKREKTKFHKIERDAIRDRSAWEEYSEIQSEELKI